VCVCVYTRFSPANDRRRTHAADDGRVCTRLKRDNDVDDDDDARAIRNRAAVFPTAVRSHVSE